MLAIRTEQLELCLLLPPYRRSRFLSAQLPRPSSEEPRDQSGPSWQTFDTHSETDTAVPQGPIDRARACRRRRRAPRPAAGRDRRKWRGEIRSLAEPARRRRFRVGRMG